MELLDILLELDLFEDFGTPVLPSDFPDLNPEQLDRWNRLRDALALHLAWERLTRKELAEQQPAEAGE